MEKQTLFGELALRLSSHPENVATEALLYLLDRHASAWQSLRDYLNGTMVYLPDSLIFRSQVWSEEIAQPDLLGIDEHGKNALIIEAKFWAGLTENQPVTYLMGLPPGSPGILLVLCPEKRIKLLWEKLLARVLEASLAPGQTTRLESGFIYCHIGEQHLMVALSWSQLLGVLRREADKENDAALLSDATQLKGLCDRMDSQAFLPLRPEHLGADLGMRVQHFADLVDDVVSEMVIHHGADTKGLTTGGKQSTYGRYFRVGEFALFFKYSPSLWARHGETPFWLRVKHVTEDGWTNATWLSEGLDRLPPGKFQRLPYSDGTYTVGISVPISVERDEVLAKLISQVNEVVAALSSVQLS
jgi:hypothetical protein